MTHALARIPYYAAQQPPQRLPFHADPILAAIDAHEEAWSVYQVALPGQPAIDADEAQSEALTRLLGTACATREGAFCLLRHLRWFLTEEARNADIYGERWRIVQAREADLTLLLNADGIDRLVRIPVALPSGRLPALLAPRPAPARADRLLMIGEAVAAFVLVAGSCLFTAVASLV